MHFEFTIVIKPGSASRIKGDATLDTLVGIQDRLRAEGEERFPIVEYATKKELNASGGSCDKYSEGCP